MNGNLETAKIDNMTHELMRKRNETKKTKTIGLHEMDEGREIYKTNKMTMGSDFKVEEGVYEDNSDKKAKCNTQKEKNNKLE